MDNVKPGRRRYDSSGRQEQARRSQAAVLDAAQRRFLLHGYRPTTIAQIARDAGVSVETVYKAFGGKAGLVRGIYDRGLLGRGAVPAYERSDAMREVEADPAAIMRNWGVLTAEVAAEVTPIRLLIREAAASDPEMGALLQEASKERIERVRHHVRFLAERGHLRDGVTIEWATDVLWMISSVEIYELYVLQRGWSQQQFAQFVGELMIAALLP